MDENTWLRWGKGFIDTSVSGASTSSPSGYVVVQNACYGVENSLKAVLTKGGVTWDHGQKGHDFDYLIGLIESRGLANKADCDKLLASATSVCLSGSNAQSWRYPDKDPMFFGSLPTTDILNRANQAKNVYDICLSIVSAP